MSVDNSVYSVDNTARANGQCRIRTKSIYDVEEAWDIGRSFCREVEKEGNPVFLAHRVNRCCYRANTPGNAGYSPAS
jgi:hypothetical protein